MSNQPCTLTLALVLSACALFAPRASFASVASVAPDSVGAPQKAPAVNTRLQWVVEASDSARTRIEVRQRVPQDVMAYRFRVDVNEALADDASLAAMQWDAEVRVMNANGTAVHLTNGTPEQTLPILFGVELMAGDSVIVTVTIGQPANDAIVVRLTIDHDPAKETSRRLASQALRVDPASIERGLVSMWEWKNQADGELWAVVGELRENAAGMSLTDLTTGRELWSDGPSGVPGQASTMASVHRFGVLVVAGHTYRLTVTRQYKGAATGATVSGMTVATAIVVPNGPSRGKSMALR